MAPPEEPAPPTPLQVHLLAASAERVVRDLVAAVLAGRPRPLTVLQLGGIVVTVDVRRVA